MGRAPCCDKANVKRGPWSTEEDEKLKEYIDKHGIGGNWISLPQKAGLKRCGKSCRLRWLNYLRPNIKHGKFSEDEDRIICTLYASIGSRWSIIASQLPGRTDNDIKNYWNTKLKKKIMEINYPSSPNQLHHQVTLLSILQNSIPPPSSSSSSSSSSTSSPLSFRENHNSSYYHHYSQSIISYSSSNTLMSGNSSSSISTTPFNSIFQEQESFLGPNQTSQVGYGGDGTFVDQLGAGNYPYSGVEDTQKLMQQSRLWGENENPMDYGLEEIKELISTSSCNNFLFDDNKTEERVMYY